LTTIGVLTHSQQVQKTTDVLIVGAGIAGLAHAAEALDRGLSVIIIDRDSHAVGASVRNFGHCCVTAQSGELLELALVARERWLSLSHKAGFFAIQAGALTVARTAAELAVLEELAAQREPGQVKLLTAGEVAEQLGAPIRSLGETLGGAHLRDDLRVDPRQAVEALAAYLGAQPGASILWRTTFFGAENGVARTSRGEIRATEVIVCVGHDLDYVYPVLAEEHEVERCALQMLLVADPGQRIREAVLSGTSMLRYPAFTDMPASATHKKEMDAARPDLVAIGANIMFTQRPDGSLIVGDSHRYGRTHGPFLTESTSELLLSEAAALLGGAPLKVLERWQGVYASSPQHPFFVAKPTPGVTVVTITSGVGMTISFGLAARTAEEIF
jgi:FAD dependent oxidoreductase TIGR03364